MAQLIRSAESASSWTDHDLASYNIDVSSVEPDDFFHTADPSIDHIDREILELPASNNSPAVSGLAISYLSRIHDTRMYREEATIDTLVASTMELLEFAEPPATVVYRRIIPLTICGDNGRVAQTDVSLVRRSFHLIIVENKTSTNTSDPEPQVIAQAIAAFQWNNKERRHHGLDPLDSMTIPCVTMSGTCPDFYLVPVTKALDNAVRQGRRPSVKTHVLRCETLATHEEYVGGTGMEDPQYRMLVLRRFLAFRELARGHWTPFLAGLG